MAIEPATPESINKIALLQTLGIQLQEIGERHAVMCVTVDDRHRNYLGGATAACWQRWWTPPRFFPAPCSPPG